MGLPGAGVLRVLGVGEGFAPGGTAVGFGEAPAAGVGEACTFAFGVPRGVGVGFTAAFVFVGTGQR